MVYLKSIDVVGFKSFAEPTQVQFDKGVTAIVGPNGSGKSNITDAIKWVLGEQSAKSLRGSKMEDVIFSGAKHRNAQNFAEVQLSLDNQKGLLNYDAEHVVVTRRLYRSGESAFFINNERQRLKDVVELFLDSGLGKEALSIISQGRVDEVLNAKPIDRRQIIEESAGVLKYKKRKAASEEKLGQTEDNLNRVEDILYNLEGRVEPLKEEAAIAKEYLQLSETLKESDIKVTVSDIQSYQSQIRTHDQALNDLQSEQASIQSKKSDVSRTIQKTKGERHQIDQKLETLNHHLIQVTESVEKVTGQYKLIEERQKNQSQTNARIEEEQDSLNHHQKQLLAQRDEVDKTIVQLKQQKQTLATEIHELEVAFVKSDENHEETLEALKDDYYACMSKQSEVNNDIRFLERTIEEHKLKQSRLDSRLTEAYKQLKEAQQHISEIDIQKREKETQLEAVAKQNKALEAQLSEIKAEHKASEDKLYQAYRYTDQLKSRIEGLRMRDNEMAFYYQGVKAILNTTHLEGIHGAVAQNIDVPSNMTVAIETALGATMQHVIVDDEKVARSAIQFLKQKKAGRATFLPLSVIKPKHIEPSLIKEASSLEGFITVASDAVKTDKQYQNVIQNLLGRTIIADTIAHANAIAKAIHYKIRIVTLEGDVVNPGGSMTGGGTQQKQSILSQKQDIQRLESQLETYTTQTQELETRCQNYKKQQNELSDAYVKVQQQHNHLKHAIHDLSLEQDRHQEIEQRLKAEHEEFEFEMNDGYQRDNSEATLQSKQNEHAALASKLEALNTQIQALSNQSKEDKEKQSTLQQTLHQKQSDLAVIKERLKAQLGEQKRLDQENETVTAQLQKLQEQYELINSEDGNDDATLSALEEKINAFQNEKQSLNEQQDQLRQHRLETEHLIESNEKALEDIHQQLLNIENQYQDIKSAQSRLDVLIDHALTHLDEKYHMTFQYAETHYASKEEEISALRQKVKLTQMTIDELGPVNLNAIEQFEEVNERYTFLSTQQKDLREAKTTLEQIIAEMDAEVTERFSTTFHAVQKHFSDVFKALFGGGEATLSLTDDDYLTAGVEIKVQPPGKKLQHLSLLSGGERALSAIALLFAILKVRSAPFVILDEVEAALDEANVVRYAQFLRDLSHETQFIVITHRKGTMEKCDRLYGVTMQELGVSRLVSVNLNTIDDVMKEEQS
ncbi:chromosome segregation protein SMC [Staphylococcus agnetis]|uniref:chromosome segregation protein SMC n=1 Tax=Staphylococcus agnetis TaxID=985762 RepID=UPI00117F514F|nr:chromosome segregation protein SMC [Staphylococcus agnetis]MBY7663889.1 chromosome segregation protein SMC [Staphylococcus agnetis]TRW83998.1 chromosome segregation protein SMC [Staphylococcus agnetis]